MALIKVPPRIAPGFGDGFNQYLRVLEKINSIENPDEELLIDMSSCSFLTPFFLLPFTVLIQQEKNRRPIRIIKDMESGYCKTYLSLIYFEDGLMPENILPEKYEQSLSRYEELTYIPIVSFPANRSSPSIAIRENFMSVLSKLIVKQLRLPTNYVTAVMYLIDEAVNNIVDHSQGQRGYIFAQYYPSRKFIDICVADGGIGIYQNYINNGIEEVTSHKVALQYAGSGRSTKERPDAESRGFGISSSKAMVADGLDGKYLLLSGNAFLYKSAQNESITEMPKLFKWGGTIVGLRIPYDENKEFNPPDFYEI